MPVPDHDDVLVVIVDHGVHVLPRDTNRAEQEPRDRKLTIYIME